jgi:flagellar hook-associated protein 3 FlgL
MRVTEKILYGQSLTGLQDNLARMQRLQETIATQKRINRPSDDPSGAAHVIRFDTFQSQATQYLRNMDAAQTPLKVTDTTLTTAINVLVGVKAVALSEASGGSTPEERATSALQVQDAFNQLTQLANTTFNGQYIFAGFETGAPAYDAAGVYQGDSGSAQVEIGPGATVARNLPGDTVFGAALGGVDILARLEDLRVAIVANDPVAIRALLAPLGGAVQQVAERQAEVGVRLQEIEAARKSVRSLSRTVAEAQAGREDADMAKVVTEFQIQLAVLKSVQDSTARILQTSLLDFLR